MTLFRRLSIAATICLAMCSVSLVRSAPLHNSTGLPGLFDAITFDEHVFAENTLMTTSYSDLGVEFSLGAFYDTLASGDTSGLSSNVTGHWAGNFTVVNDDLVESPEAFSIKFITPVTSAAFALATDDGATTLFAAFLNGVPVERFSAATDFSGTNNYFGFTGILFDEILVEVDTQSALFDNIQTPSQVPEPSTLLLAAAGLVGGALLRRRRLGAVRSN